MQPLRYFHRQNDIGLVKYKTKSLFLNLFYPTFLVIITVVQLQMFHKKYLEHLDLPSLVRRDNSDSGVQPASSVNYGSLEADTSTENDVGRTESHPKRLKWSDMKTLQTKQIVKFFFACYGQTKWFFEVFWLFLELHLIKLILLWAFLLSIKDVSCIHIAVVVLAVFAVTSRTNSQAIYSGLISLAIGTFLILKMIYQMNFFVHTGFVANCTEAVSACGCLSADVTVMIEFFPVCFAARSRTTMRRRRS